MPMTDPYRRAAGAYSRGNRSATDPRRLEGTVLLQAAQRLDELRSTWSPRRTAELEAALLHNRKLWTIFATEMADDASVLPLALRNNVASLAVFVFKRSLELAMQPAAEPIAALVEINRAVAAGLLATPPASPGLAAQAGVDLSAA